MGGHHYRGRNKVSTNKGRLLKRKTKTGEGEKGQLVSQKNHDSGKNQEKRKKTNSNRAKKRGGGKSKYGSTQGPTPAKKRKKRTIPHKERHYRGIKRGGTTTIQTPYAEQKENRKKSKPSGPN